VTAVFWFAIVPLAVVYCAALWKDHQINKQIKSLVQKWTDE
jgi:hypothetical protein